MFGGSGLLIVVVEILAFFAVVFGTLFATVAWTTVLTALEDGTRSEVPPALSTFTVCIVINLVLLVGLLTSSTELRKVLDFGLDVSRVAMEVYLASSFICLLSTMLLLRNDSGPGKRIIMSGAVVLLGIAVLGLATFIAG